MSRALAFFAAAAILLGVGLGAFLTLSRSGDRFAQCRESAIAGGTAEIGGPFSLITETGERMDAASAITKPTLVYFGYSFCPDFCPTDLSRNAIVADFLAGEGLDVGQLFISIDPERDTPAAITDFTNALHPELVGLTGSPEEIAAAANAYRVYYRRADDDPEYYLMDHSTFTYLMDPEHGFLEFFTSDAAPEEMAERVACFVNAR